LPPPAKQDLSHQQPEAPGREVRSCAPLFFDLHPRGVEIESLSRYFFGKRSPLDGVGTEDATDKNFLLQPVRHLGKRRAQESLLRVGNTLQKRCRLTVIHANSKGKRTVS
jgi:hypothetical protein